MLHKDVLAQLCRARDLLREVETCARPIRRVARDVGMSPYHFIRLFGAVFGETRHGRRQRVRVHHLLVRPLVVEEDDIGVRRVLVVLDRIARDLTEVLDDDPGRPVSAIGGAPGIEEHRLAVGAGAAAPTAGGHVGEFKAGDAEAVAGEAAGERRHRRAIHRCAGAVGDGHGQRR